jgi:hypothetical protein
MLVSNHIIYDEAERATTAFLALISQCAFPYLFDTYGLGGTPEGMCVMVLAEEYLIKHKLLAIMATFLVSNGIPTTRLPQLVKYELPRTRLGPRSTLRSHSPGVDDESSREGGSTSQVDGNDDEENDDEDEVSAEESVLERSQSMITTEDAATDEATPTSFVESPHPPSPSAIELDQDEGGTSTQVTTVETRSREETPPEMAFLGVGNLFTGT